MLNLTRLVLVIALVCNVSVAWANPISDPSAWTQKFVQAAIKGDAEGMSALVNDSTVSGLDANAIRSGLQAAVKASGSQRAESAEAFAEKDVGSFVKRINIAVVFENQYMFYSFALGHHERGWLIYSFKADGNLNNILNNPWPG